MHEPEMVSSPGCGINSQGQRADPHGGNLIQESLLAILEKKKKKENTPARSRLHKDTQAGSAGSLAWSSPRCQALAGRHVPSLSLRTLPVPVPPVPLMAQCLHHQDSSALKPRGNSMSSHWTKITGSLGFILFGRPEACTNPSPLICNKALQRWHHLREGFPDFSTTAGALTQHPAQNLAGSRHARGSHCSQGRFSLTRRSQGASKTLPAPNV